MNQAKHVAVVITADNHTHAGKPVAKGTQLNVSEASAKAIVAVGAGRIVNTVAAEPAKKETK